MAALHYLTVQDVLWINLQVSRKVNHFNYARLEEASFYQYGYGDSNSLVPQAARFLTGFVKLHPLDAANVATAFVAFATFLRLNGYEVDLDNDKVDAWIESTRDSRAAALSAVEAVAKPTHGAESHDQPDVRAIASAAIDKFGLAVAELVRQEASAA